MVGSRKQVLANKRAGRAFQSMAAKMLHMDNVGTLGGTDLKGKLFSVELKQRKAFTGKTFMEQAIKNCLPNTIPLVMVHQTQDFHKDDLILIRFSDWEKMIEKFWDKDITKKYKNQD